MNKLKRKILRSFILPALIVLKLDKYYLKKASNKTIIINFHGVRKTSKNYFNNRHIEVEEFEKIINYLNYNFEIISLKDAFIEPKEKNTKKRVAITFDDGYLNNFEVALPILGKYNVKATFFIVTKGLINPDFYIWPDLLDLAQSNYNGIFEVDGYNFASPNYFNPILNKSLIEYIKTQGNRACDIVNQITSKVENFKSLVSSNSELIEIIRKDNIVKYSNITNLDLQSHTHNHFNLEYLSEEEVENELSTSKNLLEQIIQRKVDSVAYPDGSYNDKINSIACQVGYNKLLVVDYKNKENKSVASHKLRFTISNSTTFESNILRLAKHFEAYSF